MMCRQTVKRCSQPCCHSRIWVLNGKKWLSWCKVLPKTPRQQRNCWITGVVLICPPLSAKDLRRRPATGDGCRAAHSSGRADVLLKRIVQKLNLYDFYHNFSARAVIAENRVKTCQAFIDFAASQKLSVRGLLDKVEEFKAAAKEPAAEALLITSVHRAKGLEWPLVILPGLEDGAFPFYREHQDRLDDMEDERRLFYVAMTRAIEQVVCIHPVDAELKRCMAKCCGKVPGGAMVRASRFLYEANPGLSVRLGEMLGRDDVAPTVIAEETATARQYLTSVGARIQLVEEAKEEKAQANPSRKILEIQEIGEGLRVWHQVFGAGTVTAVRDRRQGRLTVSFDDHGEMILLAGYARLQSF